MQLFKTHEKICQSCSMPLVFINQYGTELDGSLNEFFCKYCYSDSSFIEPNTTLNETIKKVTYMLVDMKGVSKEEASQYLENLMPKLKRWRQ